MNLKIAIVDDEPLARERIRTMLADEANVEIIGESAGGPHAVGLLNDSRPGLVFLDVQMPGLNGFEILRAIDPRHIPEVVFVTAYDQHALAAFEVHALDYLLKPFKKARFQQALQRARERLEQARAGQLNQRLLDLLEAGKSPHLSRLAIKTSDKVLFLKTEQIDWIEAAGNYVVLHVGRQTHVLRETLGALEAQLDPEQFLRISRSALVQIRQVKELQPLFKGEYVVVLQSGEQLPMTRGVREVEELLKFS